ncbi:MAG: hypothetical protein AB8B95_11395 [Pseudohongiellaceae bacterium]
MNWDAIGAIAEVIGAAGVILSLIYLALQIRQSNTTDKLNATLSLQNSYNQVGDTFLRDGELLAKGFAGFQDLTPAEKLKFAVIYHLFFGHIELIFGHDEIGLVDSDLSNRTYQTMRAHYAFPGVKQWWHEIGKKTFSDEFIAFVERGDDP